MSSQPTDDRPRITRAPHVPLTSEDIERWLVHELAHQLGLPEHEIDIREPFASYGLSSIATVSFSGRLEDWLGLELPPTLAWDYPTIESLAGYLAKELSERNSRR